MLIKTWITTAPAHSAERWHVTLEQGGTTLREDQQAYMSGFNAGNNTAPFFGQQLDLTGWSEAMESAGTAYIPRACSPPAPFLGSISTASFYIAGPKPMSVTTNSTQEPVVLSSPLFYTVEQALNLPKPRSRILPEASVSNCAH